MEERIITEQIYVKETRLHNHKDELELILVIKGEIKLHKVERMIVLKENEFSLVNRGVPHYIESEGAVILSTRIRLSCFTTIFDKMEFVEFLTLDEFIDITHPLKKRLDGIIIDFVIKNYQYQEKNYYIAEKKYNEEQLMFMLYSSYQLINHNRNYEQYYSKDLVDRYYTVTKYISLHILEKIKAEDVLDEVYMNPTYFSQFMKKVGGSGFKEFVNYRKLMVIMNYMVNENKSLADIAYDVGITDMKSFYHIFKKYHNMSPVTWKKKMSVLVDDYHIDDDPKVLSEFIAHNNIEMHKENTLSKMNKYLILCKANNVDLRGVEIAIDPYLDCEVENIEYYQPYKYFSSVYDLLSYYKIGLILEYQYDNLKLEGERTLLLNTLKISSFRNGSSEMRKWRIIIHVSNLDDFNEAKKFKHRITEEFSMLHVQIILDVFVKKYNY